MAPPQSHHQSAWLRPRPPSKKRVRGTRKRAKRVSARRWMFRLVRSDVAGAPEKNWRCSRWPCRATSTVRSTCGGRRRGGTSSSSSNPVERSVRVGSPLTQCPPERPVVCRFRFRPTSCRQVPRRTRCSRRRCCPLLPRRSRVETEGDGAPRDGRWNASRVWNVRWMAERGREHGGQSRVLSSCRWDAQTNSGEGALLH